MNHEEEFLRILFKQNNLHEILEKIGSQNLNNWYVGAGAIAQIIWNHFHSFESYYGIKDVDVIYFDDQDLTDTEEEVRETKLQQALNNVPLQFDLTNEARVHLWYEQKFGKQIAPYTSSEDAISTWPTTASAIGITLKAGKINVFAPFGLKDLMSLVVRPNKKLISKEIYDKKAQRWKSIWPRLTIISWDSVV